MSSNDELERILLRAWEEAHRRWPRTHLSHPDYARFILQLLQANEADVPNAAQAQLRALVDLYLVCACLSGLRDALQTLEEEYLSKLPELLAYLKLSREELDEICQRVRIHLLVGTSPAGPRLKEYSGRGALLNWIKVIAVRMSLRQSEPAQDPLDEIADIPAPDSSPEMALIKLRFKAEFKKAFRRAVAELPKPYHLLKLYYIHQLSTTAVAGIFAVNQSTISRWLKAAREEIYDLTKRFVQESLGLNTGEFTSLVNDIQSQIDFSISQVSNKASSASSVGTELGYILFNASKTAQTRWPQIEFPHKKYAECVLCLYWRDTEKLTPDRVQSLALVDLYLVFACLGGLAGAVQILETEYLDKLPEWLARRHLSPTVLEEVRQTVRVQLLSDKPPAGPPFKEYQGQVPLLDWLQRVANEVADSRG